VEAQKGAEKGREAAEKGAEKEAGRRADKAGPLNLESGKRYDLRELQKKFAEGSSESAS